VISSVGHHTDRTLIDDVAAVSCSTPTHAAEAAVPVDLNAATAAVTGHARRLRDHGRRAVLARARLLSQLSRAPGQHVARHRGRLHQLVREMRASGRRAIADGRSLASVHLLVLRRSASRSLSSDTARRRAELDRVALALAAHDPDRTLQRGYAMVEDRSGELLTSASAARVTRDLRIRFHDDVVPAVVDEAPPNTARDTDR
jgi:exodeoxyribonuclease VII large subunit